jgi:signal transduction histidine kinase
MDKRKNFYLIYKEAIHNAYKYSESNNVNVTIAEQDKMIIMIITDNGKGFDVVKNNLGGNGMKNMEIRAKEIGAKIEITSWPGKGTRIFLKMKV